MIKRQIVTVGEIEDRIRSKHPHLALKEGWPTLLVNGRQWDDPANTVAEARMFGAKVSCGAGCR